MPRAPLAAFLPPALLIFLASSAGADPVTWSGNGHQYDAMHTPAGINWRQAYDACQARGGYLATLTSSAEHAFVYGLVSSRPELWYQDTYNNGIGPWLGGFQPSGSPEPGGGWRWVSDEPWSYTAWSSGEPNNSGGVENRLAFFKSGALIGDRWNDMGENALIHGYVIEIPTPARECTTWTQSGHTYQLVRTPSRVRWSTASAGAIARGGHLATISSQAENDLVASFATPDPTLWCIDPAGNGQGPWIGGVQSGGPEPAGGWGWVTGESFGDTHWAPGEPNNLNGVEHWLQLFGYRALTGNQWNDMTDSTAYGGLGYIVEYEEGGPCRLVGVEEPALRGLQLAPPRPNPAKERAMLELDLPAAARVRVDVFDVAGRHVRRLVAEGRFEAGAHALSWDGRDDHGAAVRGGIYLVRVRVDERALARRVVLIE